MESSAFFRLSTLLCAAALAAVGLAAAPGDWRLQEARSRAAACLERDYDGRAFRDPYFAYVYPEEKLPPAAADPALTYRRIDADIMLALLERETRVPSALCPAVDRAAQVLRELPVLWRGRGFSNVRRGPRPEGIALDTFCIVGWLETDRGMAREAAGALDGDAWLPVELYEGEERFRRDADEAWCLRLLASPAGGGIAPARGVLERLIADLREARNDEPAGRRAFYAAYHLALVLEESPDRSEADLAGLRQELEATLEGWAAARPAGAERDSELLEWANLAATRLPGLDRTGLRRRAVDILLRQQAEDGCWRVAGARPPETGSSFLTLRALLALAAYREP